MSRLYKRSREAAPKLDLNTLTDQQREIADEFGVSTWPTRGPSWGWTARDFGNGHVEITGTYCPDGHRALRGKKNKVRKPRAKHRNQMSPADVMRSCERSKRKVKELTKMLVPDKLITCTTRAAIVEYDQFKAITTKFFRLCRKEFNDFRYIAVFERHMSERTSAKKFGSLHLHFAAKGRLDYNKLRHFWRITVSEELKSDDYKGANINVQSSNSSYYSRVKIGQYMSKYITKDMHDDNLSVNKRRYWASKNIESPKKVRLYTVPAMNKYTYLTIFSEIFGVDLQKVFMPDRTEKFKRPLIWLST